MSGANENPAEFTLGLNVGKRDWDIYGNRVDVIAAFGKRVDHYVQGWLKGYYDAKNLFEAPGAAMAQLRRKP